MAQACVHPIGTKTEFFDQAAARSQNARLALRTPEHLMQSPDRVAAAIVRCLRKPRGEVWTSTPTRIALGLAVMFPGIAERLIDEKGEVRRFVNVYVNEEDIRFLDNQDTKIKDGDEISIIPAIAGG